MKRKNQKGFTLVEVSVSMVIFVIAVSLASGIIIMAGNIFGKNTSLAEAARVGQTLSQLVSDKLTCATALDVRNTSTPSDVALGGAYDEQLVFSNDGNSVQVLRKETGSQTVADEKFFSGMKPEIEIELNPENKNTLLVKVRVYDGDYEKCLYDSCVTVPLLNKKETDTNFKTGGSLLQGETYSLVVSYSYAE